jgi:hypothetical protein
MPHLKRRTGRLVSVTTTITPDLAALDRPPDG